MKTKTIGILIIAAGIIMVLYTGFNFVTSENVVDLGPIQINKEKNHPIQWSPIVGITLLVVGVALLVVSGIKRNYNK